MGATRIEGVALLLPDSTVFVCSGGTNGGRAGHGSSHLPFNYMCFFMAQHRTLSVLHCKVLMEAEGSAMATPSLGSKQLPRYTTPIFQLGPGGAPCWRILAFREATTTLRS